MDYLDRRKELTQNIMLMLGYVLIAVAIVISALILLYQAYGFGLNQKGVVVQNGLLFFSSHPNPATITTNGVKQPQSTNTRMTLTAGVYKVAIARRGYYDWQRKIEVAGGDVQHFDYPFLIPKQLAVRNVQPYAGLPGLMTQSPDRRWLIVQSGASLTSLSLYDLKNPDKAVQPLELPGGLLTNAAGAESWQALDWADDNKHFMLQHIFDGQSEYILVDRTSPQDSVNLTKTLSVNPTKLEFKNRKYDRYYAYDAPSATLRSLRLNQAVAEPVFQRILAYKSYGDNTLLYVTDSGAPAEKVLVKLTDGAKTWNIRTFPAGSSYVVDLTKYSGSMYVAAGSAGENKVYIYKDPAAQLDNRQQKVASPVQVLHVKGVNYLSFSASAQFILAENGNQFGVYDIENKIGYNYKTSQPLDAPQEHVTWMDGNRLQYVSNQRLIIFDYDYMNVQALTRSVPQYKPAFGPDFKYLYLLSPADNGQFNLTETALLTSNDL